MAHLPGPLPSSGLLRPATVGPNRPPLLEVNRDLEAPYASHDAFIKFLDDAIDKTASEATEASIRVEKLRKGTATLIEQRIMNHHETSVLGTLGDETHTENPRQPLGDATPAQLRTSFRNLAPLPSKLKMTPAPAAATPTTQRRIREKKFNCEPTQSSEESFQEAADDLESDSRVPKRRCISSKSPPAVNQAASSGAALRSTYTLKYSREDLARLYKEKLEALKNLDRAEPSSKATLNEAILALLIVEIGVLNTVPCDGCRKSGFPCLVLPEDHATKSRRCARCVFQKASMLACNLLLPDEYNEAQAKQRERKAKSQARKAAKDREAAEEVSKREAVVAAAPAPLPASEEEEDGRRDKSISTHSSSSEVAQRHIDPASTTYGL
ncbi:hypothetical protein BJ170DRAFT_625417 [Xylariales sp. AK1849]|nr:hypothetical protein BJ170DRAFT_625417 [Xylariales sp. AK1849]